ncbi:uncharacterized protein [Procambarus clarkii]|uniref:uncharacterized protein n=1 Tax=Procambarus clarkii TaxID=6728 RepID=UPI00374220B6
MDSSNILYATNNLPTLTVQEEVFTTTAPDTSPALAPDHDITVKAAALTYLLSAAATPGAAATPDPTSDPVEEAATKPTPSQSATPAAVPPSSLHLHRLPTCRLQNYLLPSFHGPCARPLNPSTPAPEPATT